jgi:hypothetical protein
MGTFILFTDGWPFKGLQACAGAATDSFLQLWPSGIIWGLEVPLVARWSPLYGFSATLGPFSSGGLELNLVERSNLDLSAFGKWGEGLRVPKHASGDSGTLLVIQCETLTSRSYLTLADLLDLRFADLNYPRFVEPISRHRLLAIGHFH